MHDKLKSLSTKPGVYLMKDEKGRIIYVGKAKNLANRVSSYFTALASKDLKTQKLIEEICDFDLVIVLDEAEALILERSLIREHQPKYNVLFKDDKEYPYLRIDLNEKWPRFKKVRRKKNDKAVYLGPYSRGVELRHLLQLIYEVFPLIRCSEHEFANATRPCNYFHMKRCLAPCTLPVAHEVYQEMIKNAIAVLQGHDFKRIQKMITQKMEKAAEREDYETAKLYRDQLLALKAAKIPLKPLTPSIVEADIFHDAYADPLLCFHVLNIRSGTIVSSQNFVSENKVDAPLDVFGTFLMHYYEKRELPKEICLPKKFPELEAVTQALSKTRKVKIHIPIKGERKKSLEIAALNAEHALHENKENLSQQEANLKNLQEELGLTILPRRIECFDISNFQETAIVASCAVFIDAKPAKHLYRSYHINSIVGKPDDFSSMREVLTRRFLQLRKDDRHKPDLIIIDGGKGQLSIAWQVKANFPELASITMMSLAKSKVTAAPLQAAIHSSYERIFVSPKAPARELALGSLSFRVLTHLRDEAHRFAINHHRKKFKKMIHESSLDDIPGVGPVLRKRLLLQFKNVQLLKKLSVEELMQVKGVSQKLALEIKKFFS